MSQSPMISIPKKSTDEVDWTTPIRTLIAQSYGENPDNYSAECASLQRCRQDAVRGAGSDMTARDLLYKYFGQLELLELRFSEIRVTFPWHDAFTNKLTTQTSIAYEKASILFQIASTHSAIASSQNRSSPEGLKRSFYYFRTCAGMLTYINENFLHAPSKDLSKEVVKFLVGVIIAQATEVFWEKCVDEKKASALVAKVASQAATMYTTLCEEVKEFAGQNILDRHWVTLIQIKSKYLTSQAQYHRSIADTDAGTYGDALARLTLAETLAKEALRLCSSFTPTFTPATSTTPSSSTLPADAGSSMLALAKSHLALVSDRRTAANRENDLIYNAILPSQETLPPIETKATLTVATPIPIQEVYGAPDVQKTIGADFFGRLVPLSVHESASVYSEEKAKLVRGEVERADTAEGEAKSFLDGLHVVQGLERFRGMLQDSGATGGVPPEVSRWAADIASIESRESVASLFSQLEMLKGALRGELDPGSGIARELDAESRDCEMMRVRYEHLWTQVPSAGLNKSVRQDLKAHVVAMDEAARSDAQVQALWEGVRPDVEVLAAGRADDFFANQAGEDKTSLLDFGEETDRAEREEKEKISGLVRDIEERLATLKKIEKERNEVLKDLKEKIQTDDVSHLLLLNRRNTGVEPTLFAAELEKFRPYQQRLAATIHHQETALEDVAARWKTLKDFTDYKSPARKWDEKEKRRKDGVRRFGRAREGYEEVRDGLAKGLQFYTELTELTVKLRRNVKAFVASRVEERERLAAKLESEKRLASSGPPPLAAKPPSSTGGLELGFAGMNLRGSPAPPPQWQPNAPQSPHQQYPPPPPSQYSSPAQSYPSAPPPPSQYSSPPPPPSQQYYSPQQPQQPQRQQSFPPPPPQPAQYSQPPQSYAPSPPPAPANDPYAHLGMFSPASYSAQTPSPGSTHGVSSPPPPPPPPHGAYAPSHAQPQPPPQGQYGAYQQYQQPQQPPAQQASAGQHQGFGGAFPPPPPPVSYQYGAPPPAAPQYQQQGSYQGYSRG
ncbi:BRO1-like domain-containing protein [Mycena rosella]|uniref:BRO domain-containing protein 1 n=1 Tax=Mycena rosella TaxID=1033263 RepID=A0AAD7GTU6_MYCRO|nr:BRO1-like domain-containing protein [Mycena rosella]